MIVLRNENQAHRATVIARGLELCFSNSNLQMNPPGIGYKAVCISDQLPSSAAAP